MRAAFTFFPVKKSKQKRPVQKKAIAKHRSFIRVQNAFSIACFLNDYHSNLLFEQLRTKYSKTKM
jgi:hypothetical protein